MFADGSSTTTVVICKSSSGIYIPPTVVCAQKRLKAELQDGAPPDKVFVYNESSWMYIKIFTSWFEHFLPH